MAIGTASAAGGAGKVHVAVGHDAAKALQSALKTTSVTSAKLGNDTLKMASAQATAVKHPSASMTGGGSKLLSVAAKGADTISASHTKLMADTFAGGAAKSTILRNSDAVATRQDLFVFQSNHTGTAHVIQSFKEGADKLVLSGYSKSEIASALSSQKVVAGSLTLKLSDKTTITLTGHDHKLSASDFIVK